MDDRQICRTAARIKNHGALLLHQGREQLDDLRYRHCSPVSVICFMRPDGGLIHLVTTNAPPSGDYTVRREAKFVQQHESAKATWREGDKVYMLALEGAPDQLRVIAHEKTARLVQRW